MATVKPKARPKDEEPPPGTERVRWWKAKLRAAARRGETLETPRGNMAAVLAAWEVRNDPKTKARK